jgi:hypothetical protein
MFDASSLATRWNGRCLHCGHSPRHQGHREGCHAGLCSKCHQFPSWFATKRCLWCLAQEQRTEET